MSRQEHKGRWSTAWLEAVESWPDLARRLLPTFAALLAVGLILGLGVVGHHGHGPFRGFDHRANAWFPDHRYHLAGLSEVIAVIFDATGLGPLCVLIAAVLWLRWPFVRAVVPLVAYLGAEALVFIVKVVVAEPRPVTRQLVHETSHAFPSGHATAGAAVLFSLAALIVAERRSKWPWLFAAAGAVLIGWSRLILGVHWFADVTIGAILGAAWGLAVARSLLVATHEARQHDISTRT